MPVPEHFHSTIIRRLMSNLLTPRNERVPSARASTATWLSEGGFPPLRTSTPPSEGTSTGAPRASAPHIAPYSNGGAPPARPPRANATALGRASRCPQNAPSALGRIAPNFGPPALSEQRHPAAGHAERVAEPRVLGIRPHGAEPRRVLAHPDARHTAVCGA